MEGVISLLDEQHQHRVESIWAGLKAEFGVRGVYITPYPHFSYHVAKKYHAALLADALTQIAATNLPFRIRANGIGIFSGAAPVLYIPLVRDGELSRLHAEVWQSVGAAVAKGAIEHYSPVQWMPHITIGQSDITTDNLGPIVAWLNQQPLDWEVPITSIGTIYAKGSKQYLGAQFTFTINQKLRSGKLQTRGKCAIIPT